MVSSWQKRASKSREHIPVARVRRKGERVRGKVRVFRVME
jgi:hypothetical protein